MGEAKQRGDWGMRRELADGSFERVLSGAPETRIGDICAQLILEFLRDGSNGLEFDVNCATPDGAERFSLHFEISVKRVTDG